MNNITPRKIVAKCHLTDELLNYDLILGRVIPYEIGIIILNLKTKLSLGKNF